MKCAICGNTVETTFLGKPKGSYFGKKIVCSTCQSSLKTKEEILAKL